MVSEARKGITRRTFLRGASIGTVATVVSACAPLSRVVRRRPNIVWIMADDLGFGDVGVYGQTRIQTPYLDSMAAEGMKFTSAYTGYPVCRPARCSLVTGYHMGHAYIRENFMDYPLRPEDVTVARILQDAGYVTGMFGKWALGNEGTTGIPSLQGFDEFWGWLDQTEAHDYYPSVLWHNEQRIALPGNEGAAPGTTYAPDFLIEKALSFIEAHAKDPFFVYLPFTLPHADNSQEDSVEGLPVPSLGQYATEDWPDFALRYAAMVTRLDSHVGQVLAKLEDLGLSEDTLVFFTSDNGPHEEGGYDPDFFGSSGPLTGIKRSLYAGGIRMPMIARWPGSVPAGAVSDFAWAFWDFLPTAAELARADVPSDLDGMSIVPTLRGETQAPHRYLYWEQNGLNVVRQTINLYDQAIRDERWKLIMHRNHPPELYFLAGDPGEKRDLAAEYPEPVERLQSYLIDVRTPPIVLPDHL